MFARAFGDEKGSGISRRQVVAAVVHSCGRSVSPMVGSQKKSCHTCVLLYLPAGNRPHGKIGTEFRRPYFNQKAGTLPRILNSLPG